MCSVMNDADDDDDDISVSKHKKNTRHSGLRNDTTNHPILFFFV